MENNKELSSNEKQEPEEVKKPYIKPELFILGDLRSVVLGGTLGTGESGGTLVRKALTPSSSGSTDEASTEGDPAAPVDPGAPEE